MNFILVVAMLSQVSSPPLVGNPDLVVREPAVPRGPYVALETAKQVEAPPEPVRRRLWELFVPGSIAAFGGWLVGGVIPAVQSNSCWSRSLFTAPCESPSAQMIIPLIGPWIAISRTGTADPFFGHHLAYGVVQLAGLAAMVAGLAIGVSVGDASVSLAPTGDGVALGGTF